MNVDGAMSVFFALESMSQLEVLDLTDALVSVKSLHLYCCRLAI